MVNTTLAKGTKLNVSDGGSPISYDQLLGVTEIQVPSPETADLKTTNHDDTSKSETYEPGLLEPGDMSVLYFDDPANAQQAQLVSDQAAGTTRLYQTEIPTSPADTKGFSAYVKKIEPATPVDGLAMKRATLKVTGAVT